MADTPSQAVINAANTTTKVKDSRGRMIEIRKLKTLDRMRLFELIGADNSSNDRYLGYAALAYSVVSIDGEPQPHIQTKVALEGVVQELDDEGFNAIADALRETAKSEPTAAEFKDQVKNA